MINLTKNNIDKAIVNKAYDMVRKSEAGYLYTDETVCTFNSMLIFKDLFNNKCRMLDDAFEKLYYIADKIIQCVRPTPEDELYTVTVVTTPSDADVTINNVATKQRSLASGTKVTIVAKLDGYYDKSYTIESLIKDETVEIAFTDEDRLPRYFNININTIPSNAVCKINGEVTKSAKILENKVCNIEVTADGYIPYTYSFIVKEDKNLNIKLEVVPEEDIIITVNPTPSDAVVKIDGVTGNTRSVKKGNHTVVVSKQGMNTYTLTKYFDTNTVLEPKLTITIGVVTVPSDATVLINGIQRRIITAIPGQFTIQVSKTGYVTRTITKTYNTSSVEEIKLEEEIQTATITVVAQPSGAAVKIDGVTTISKTVPIGTTVNVNVTLDGYIPYNRNYTVNEDMTVEITLKNTQSVNFFAFKYDVHGEERDQGINITYSIEGDETVYTCENNDVFELPINKEITFVCSADGYGTETKRYTFSGNYTMVIISVPLYPEAEPATEFTLIVDTIPNDAVVTIDGETTKQKTVSAGNHTIVVSKTGYTTVTQTVDVQNNMTVRITLEPLVATVTLNVIATPNDSIITIDNENISSKNVTPGTSHTVTVRKTGYATYTEVVTVNEDTTLEVTLRNTKTVQYNVSKEGTSSTSLIMLTMLQNGEYVQIPIGEDIEVPYDTFINVKASAGPNYEEVTRSDFFSSNATNAYEKAIINIVIPRVTQSEVLLTFDNVPYNSTKKANGVVFTEDSVHVAKNHIAIIDITCFGYTNYRIVIKPTTDRLIHVNMTTSNLIELVGDMITFKFTGSNREQYFTVDDGIMASANQEIQISRGTHKIDSHIIPEPDFTGDPDISFTDVYNENTEFLIIIE